MKCNNFILGRSYLDRKTNRWWIGVKLRPNTMVQQLDGVITMREHCPPYRGRRPVWRRSGTTKLKVYRYIWNVLIPLPYITRLWQLRKSMPFIWCGSLVVKRRICYLEKDSVCNEIAYPAVIVGSIPTHIAIL